MDTFLRCDDKCGKFIGSLSEREFTILLDQIQMRYGNFGYPCYLIVRHACAIRMANYTRETEIEDTFEEVIFQQIFRSSQAPTSSDIYVQSETSLAQTSQSVQSQPQQQVTQLNITEID